MTKDELNRRIAELRGWKPFSDYTTWPNAGVLLDELIANKAFSAIVAALFDAEGPTPESVARAWLAWKESK